MGVIADRPILFSFDAEEFDLPVECGGTLPRGEQFRLGTAGFECALDLLEQASHDAGVPMPVTFFTTAALAVHAPAVVRRAVSAGHEIASHAFDHSAWRDEDLARSRRTLGEISGSECVGFRRPRLAPTDPGLIARAGYRYDSGINPTWLPGRYNHLRTPRGPHMRGDILEIPASVTPVLRVPLFWLAFKALPLSVTKLHTWRVLGSGTPLVLYFHPWELLDLRGYRVPSSVRLLHGPRMIDRLTRYLAFLAEQGTFMTYASYAQRWFARTVPTRPARTPEHA